MTILYLRFFSLLLILIILNLSSTLFSSEQEEIPEELKKKPVAGIKKNPITIQSWTPSTSLSTHFGHGSNKKNEPIFNFNLNLAYVRFFMKSDIVEDDTYLFNTGFSYIIELKPFDFASFLSSGSSYSIFIEKNEALRNFTLIFNNKTFSSTQFLTANHLYYFDFLYNAINVENVIIPQSKVSSSALENLYPNTREEGIGVSDRFHIVQTENLAIGLVFYFEFNLPKGTREVAKGPSRGQLDYLYSDLFTYAFLTGAFLHYKEKNYEMKAHIIYHWLHGNFDSWVITTKQNSVAINYEFIYNKRNSYHFNYNMINWQSDEYEETTYLHTINLGMERKGFGEYLNWLGAGIDFYFQINEQERGAEFLSNFFAYGFSIPISWYPLAFHSDNYKLKISLIYGIFNYYWQKDLFASSIIEQGDGFADSIMLKVNYSF